SELDSILFMPYAGAPPQENIVLLGSDANILPTQLPAGEAALLREGITAGRQYLNDLVPR
ncbi:MAG TPA: hypothetical protein VF598_07015, partial [Hymenobacter sp.]